MEKKKVIFFHSRRAEQTFTRIWLLDQLLGVDQPLPLSSLPTTRHLISRSPALGTLLYTPHSRSGITFFFFFFWCLTDSLQTQTVFFFFSPHPHSLSWLTLGGKKYRRSPGHQASSSFYQHLIHHCCFLFFPLVEFMVCLQIHAIVFSSKGIHKERHNNDTREERWESWESWTLRSISRAGQSWILNSKTA